MDNKPEPDEKDYDPNWAKNLMAELKQSLTDVGDSFEKAWREGKNDPKIKKFGENMKNTFKQMGEDIEELFSNKSSE
jgi:hypothetical protein